jgi:prophage tail gpP-like protein
MTPNFKGNIDSKKFKRLRVEPGENVWIFLERIARMRHVICGSDEKGNFQFVGKGGGGSSQATLEEGKNIEKIQCIFSVENTQSEYIMNSQSAATDGHSGPLVSQQKAKVKGTAKAYSPLKTPNEHNVWDEDEVKTRVEHEQFWHEGDVLQAVITVQGWKTESPKGGSLWKVGSNVHVKSPMCPLDVELGVQAAIFTQDDKNGTQTTLVCVPPWLLNGESEFNMSQSSAPQDPTSYGNQDTIQPSQ